MGEMSFLSILKILGDFGVVGLILFLWWADNRRFQSLLDQYSKDMNEQRQMYKANVSLVTKCSDTASDLKDVIILNTRAMQTLCDDIRANEFCPVTRISKRKAIIGEQS